MIYLNWKQWKGQKNEKSVTKTINFSNLNRPLLPNVFVFKC